MVELEFQLDKPAKRAGGDKYICSEQSEFTIYIPQTISRVNGEPIKKLKVNIITDIES